MDEEERRFTNMSADEFDRETEELLDKAGVTHSEVLKDITQEDEDNLLNSVDESAEQDDTDKSTHDVDADKRTSGGGDDDENSPDNNSPKNDDLEKSRDQAEDETPADSTTNEETEKLKDASEDESNQSSKNIDDAKQKLLDNVEENIRALQSDEVTNSNENNEDDETTSEYVNVNSKNDKSNTNEDGATMDVDNEDPFGGTEESMDATNDTNDKNENNDNNDNNDNDNDKDAEVEAETEADAEKDTEASEHAPSPTSDSQQSSATTKGADEELCIIPDTEREITQAEKDAATAKKKEEGTTDKSKRSENGETVNEHSMDHDSAKSDSGAGDDVTNNKDDAERVDGLSPMDTSQIDENNVGLKEPIELDDRISKLEDEEEQDCCKCGEKKMCAWKYVDKAKEKESYLCSETCCKLYLGSMDKSSSAGQQRAANKIKVSRDKNAIREPLVYVRKCHECKKEIVNEERNLSWECMEFCNDDCLAKYQTAVGGHCANCKDTVPLPSLGKYCVRFGYDIRQFCSSSCLEDFKKGLKVCSYCQKDISGGVEGFLAPVGDKGQFKDFCTQSCMEKYDTMSNNHGQNKTVASCDVCSNEKLIRLEIEVEGVVHKLCSEPCFVAFKFANNVSPEQCHMCQKYFEQTTLDYTIYFDDQPHHFCCKTCQNVYIIANRKIVPCQWCKVKKYNFDMIKKVCLNGTNLMMCSINCLALYQVSINAAVSTRNYPMNVMSYPNQMNKTPISLQTQTTFEKTPSRSVQSSTGSGHQSGGSQSKRYTTRTSRNSSSGNEGKIKNKFVKDLQQPPPSTSPQMPIITSVHSLAQPQTNGPSTVTRSSSKSTGMQTPIAPAQPSPPVTQITQTASPATQQIKPKYIQQVIVKPPPVPEIRNKSTMCKPNMHTKGVSFKPHVSTKETQTDDSLAKTVIVPVPVPIYVPSPMALFSTPFPVPVPFPLPVPIPIFIPTTRNSAHGIMKEIKKIQVKIPTDPFEAELLMMAEMVAGDKKVDNTDSESEDDDNGGNEGDFSPEAVDTSNTFGDDMLQMALKMATELDEPAVDLEGALTANTITASQSHDGGAEEEDDNQHMHHHAMMAERGGGRGRKRQGRSPRAGATGSKRGRRMSGHSDMPMMPPPQATAPPPPPEPVEKPDANMCLKYTFGVNAWKQWVTTKNAELEKSTLPLKPFKSEILQLTADELNYSLCLFVKEVRKPNGSEYAPDTIYYLCLGIQQYLFENGRIDNIFTDAFYEKFTECLDEVARKFSVLYNDSHYIVTRVEEEHLWESKQLGAHSPHVLLSTLMFFNTKHFNLTTVDEHMQLSFSHIMKHWKRNPNQPGASKGPGSRNVLLRFYPPQSALDANARKKKVYEQQENEENPLRCPVKLYEFYLSKCPESVKTRNDVFYLLPERSCVPDSPVWYSTMALGRNALEKMLHRVKMVKEINVALLTS
ncbi:zinc finger MYM-type protein 3-like isoform X2 [Chrysoperla carnea]|uniref:zinc finger MYM-type protein 3-like isoform X2 n=1 Tax=Chrysoperla carnea TaxID=189513 RepID=UPI001D08D8CB|nr:zinc finger MYM-type protein 3-like isoform X2 [Chrysoperla carnea]